MKLRALLLPTALLINAGLFVSSLGSSLPSRDEVRQVPAGLSVVKHGSFALANDAPPLTRLVSSIPTSFTRTYSFSYDLRETEITFDSSLREREEEYAAYFAAANARKYLGLIHAARALNLGWWLLGAWVVGRWARELQETRRPRSHSPSGASSPTCSLTNSRRRQRQMSMYLDLIDSSNSPPTAHSSRPRRC